LPHSSLKEQSGETNKGLATQALYNAKKYPDKSEAFCEKILGFKTSMRI
jgi:hypothetical protein